jgi:hypothetical protein
VTKGYKHATFEQVIQINDLLKLYCLRDESTGLAMYLSGWSDQVIADRVDCPAASVASLRQKIVGRLIPKRQPKPKQEDLALEVERLKAAVAALQHQVGEVHAALANYDRQMKSVTAELLSSTSLAKR